MADWAQTDLEGINYLELMKSVNQTGHDMVAKKNRPFFIELCK